MTPGRAQPASQVPWRAVGAGAACVLGLSLLLRAHRVETRLHALNEQKFVDADPWGLASLRGVDLDTYALASCMQSEERTLAGRVAVGHVVLNYCRRRQVSPATLLLRSLYRGRLQPSHGHLASQEAPGKWASTARPPSDDTLLLARELRSGSPRYPDPTRGATSWDSPALQDKKHAEDPLNYPKDSRQVAADRAAAGGVEVRVPGVSGTRFWRFA